MNLFRFGISLLIVGRVMRVLLRMVWKLFFGAGWLEIVRLWMGSILVGCGIGLLRMRSIGVPGMGSCLVLFVVYVLPILVIYFGLCIGFSLGKFIESSNSKSCRNSIGLFICRLL